MLVERQGGALLTTAPLRCSFSLRKSRVISNARKSPQRRGRKGALLPRRASSRTGRLFERCSPIRIDPTMVAFGEENRDWGGAFAVYRGLTEASLPPPVQHPHLRGSIAGAATGTPCPVDAWWPSSCTATHGPGGRRDLQPDVQVAVHVRGRPQDAAGAQGVRGGEVRRSALPGLELDRGAHPGAQVYFPATPYDAKGMLNLASAARTRHLLREPAALRHRRAVRARRRSGGFYEVPEGEPALRRRGKDLTWSPWERLSTAPSKPWKSSRRSTGSRPSSSTRASWFRWTTPHPRECAQDWAAPPGIGRLERGSYLTHGEHGQRARLRRPRRAVAVVGSRNWITPAAEMEEAFFPQKEWIVDAVHERLLPLKDYGASRTRAPARLRGGRARSVERSAALLLPGDLDEW